MAAGDGPLTVLPNLRGRVDANGYVICKAGVTSGSDGPLTNLWNLRVLTDTNGYVVVAIK